MTDPRNPGQSDDDQTPPPPGATSAAAPGPPEPSDEALAVRAEPISWETVIARAESTAQHEQPDPRGQSRMDAERRARWAQWIRIAIPVLILLVYAGYKVSQRAPRDPRPMQVDHITSVSGVRPALGSTSMDREVSALAAELEKLRLARDWAAIRVRIDAAPPAAQQHPVIEAFHLIARVRMGQRDPELNVRARALQPLFAEDRNRRGLYDLLLLAEAEMLYHATTSPEAALRQADTYRTLFQRMSTNSQEAINFRVRLADRYAREADALVVEAGRFRIDRGKLSDARALYQNALRWVVRPDGWRELQPVATGNAQATRDRIVLKLGDANAKFHGSSLPFTGRDNRTWTGMAGDPVHDRPGGTW